MNYNRRRVGLIKLLMNLPLSFISMLPFLSFSAYIAGSSWIQYVLPIYILSLIYFIVYGTKTYEPDNYALISLFSMIIVMILTLAFKNALLYQVLLVIVFLASIIQLFHGVVLLSRSRKKIQF